ncbi:MAG: T9SS type A sorting domain-containing protein [Bacteroidetes bacterium]|nr:T9SS type A sorting domain-containing protein [Bacteroidota bacterium]
MKVSFKSSILIAFLIAAVTNGAFAQTQGTPVQLRLEPVTISGMPPLHSYSWAKWEGKWLIFGGRTNGLHGFQPPFAFPTANQNGMIYVIDPDSNLLWSTSASVLPVAIREQIISSNQQFTQDNNYLYITGGYGFASVPNSLITFPYLTRIDVNGLMQSIVQQQSILPYFSQVYDERMAVTGGHMVIVDSLLNLVMGHRFDGRYNPNNGPSFTQTYTDAIRTFTVEDSVNQVVIRNYSETIDTLLYHKRDYNLVPQVLAGGAEVHTAFTGVFQYGIDLPWTISVDIQGGTGSLITNFEQKLNQYHTAYAPLYDSISGRNTTIFFGGMGFYYPDSLNQIQQDSLVPFVKTISYVQRDATGLTEGYFPIQMPGYEGSSAEFIPAEVALSGNGVIKLHALDTGDVVIGYIVGGITSDQPNIFMQATGTSWASSTVYKVIINTPTASGLSNSDDQLIPTLKLYPNPAQQHLSVEFELTSPEKLNLEIMDQLGKSVIRMDRKWYKTGVNSERINLDVLRSGQYSVAVIKDGKIIRVASFIKGM